MANEQDQRNIDNNANNIKNAADVAMATKNPYAMAAGGAVKAADKLTGGKSTQMLGKAMNTANKAVPGGRLLQKASNKASESGASDKIGKAASMKNGLKSGGGSKGDVPSALKNPNPDNNVTGKNTANKKKTKDDSKGLDKKDGLEKKDGLDDKKDDKKGGKGKDKDKKKSNDKKSSVKDDFNKIAEFKKKLKIYLLIAYIAAGIFVVLFVVVYLINIWNTFMTSITSFFGIREGNSYTSTSDYDESKDEGGLWVEEKYLKNNGEDVGMRDYENPDTKETIKGITTVLAEDNACNDGTLIAWFNKIIVEWDGNFDGNPCRLLNYINGTSKGWETKYDKYGLNIDEGYIISTLFYGFAEQATYISYDDPEDENYVSPNNHYDTLQNMLEGGDNAIIQKEDVDKIIRSTIFEEVWPYYKFARIPKLDALHFNWYTIKLQKDDIDTSGLTDKEEILKKYITALRKEFMFIVGTYGMTIDDIFEFNRKTVEGVAEDIYNGKTNIKIKAPVLVGQCVSYEHKFFYFSKEKWKLFMRFDDEESESGNEFGIPGYVASEGRGISGTKKILDRVNDNTNPILSTMYGSGWVYETNMNNAWLNSDPECNGTMALTNPDDYGVDRFEILESGKIFVDGRNFFIKRGVTETKDTFAYFQRVNNEELYTLNKDKMVSQTRKYTNNSVNHGGTYKTATLKFDYKYGYVYTAFPAFKKADEDEKLPGFKYDEITTPKKIEVVIQEMESRKDEYNEVLNSETKPVDYYEGPDLSIITYCNKTQRSGTGQFEVLITDCEGEYMATRSFKEYIIGVVIAEIGVNMESNLEEYVKTQMVAAISYTLGRHDNYENSFIFEMRSGSCDQNWCDIYMGCSRSEKGGYKREDGSVLLATYPGSIPDSVTTKECTIDGVTGTNYYKCPMKPNQVAHYSELFDEALTYVVASGNAFFEEGLAASSDIEAPGFNGAYVSSVQLEWRDKSIAGMTVDDILAETYPNSTVYNCKEIVIGEEYQKYIWPDVYDDGTPAEVQEELCVNYNSNYDETWNMKVIEVAYRLAGTTTGDCSSFVRKAIGLAAKELGIATPGVMSTSTKMFQFYGRCNCSDTIGLMPGDIVFHRTNPTRWMQVGHVAIFAGYNEQGQQMIFESNSRASARATGSYDKPALVVDGNTHRIAGYSRWYPPAITDCK